MKTRFTAWCARVDALTLRERLVGFCLCLGLLCLAWNSFLLTPLEARRDHLEARSVQLKTEIASLNREIHEVVARRRMDPDAGNRDRLAELRAEDERLALGLRRLTHKLVPPKQMPRLLEAVLTRETSLNLVKLQGLGPAPMVGDAGETARRDAGSRSPSSGSAEPLPVSGLYRHGLRIEFEGDYLETLEYLLALEALDWQFLWDSVHLEVIEYPRARVAITVYSLSLERVWMGV